MSTYNIGLISTRFAGLDGVSLEAQKWAEVFEEFGHKCFWFAGELDRDPSVSFLVPEAHFSFADSLVINKEAFGKRIRTRLLTDTIHLQKEFLKNKIYEFIYEYQITMFNIQNALAIPMQIPLAQAISEVIAETGIPAIAHHHDFYWERPRFLLNAVQDILEQSFPPNLPSIKHVVINSVAQADLAAKKGISSTLIYNTIDFNNTHEIHAPFNTDFRKDFGFAGDDILILQPTRIVSRKGIEQALQLVKRLEIPKAKLLISHSPGDEGNEYFDWLKDTAEQQSIPVHFIFNQLHEKRKMEDDGTKQYSLWDVYPHVDLITYPSLYEGFGNAFLEAIYFKKPLLVNRYSVYIVDIEPKGFEVIEMDGFLTEDTVKQVREVLQNTELRNKIVEKNFELGKKYFSFDVLRNRLKNLLESF